MLKFLASFLLCLAAVLPISAQSNDCNTAAPLCPNTLDTFPAGVNQPDAPIGNNYDCLGSQPNPAWYTLTIASNGSVDIVLDNTNSEDIDFILWGPFPNVAAAYAGCGNLGNGGATGGVVDCSFSGAAVEDVNIPNAQAGEVYMLLITNYSNAPTNIFYSQNAGTASLNCSCDLNVSFFETPIPQNAGTITDTTATSMQGVICAPSTPSGTPDQFFITIGIGAADIGDSLDIYAPATTIANSFQSGNFGVFGPIYPVIGRYDTMEITLLLTADYSEIGIHTFDVGIVTFGTNSCIQTLPITVVIPGVEITAPDTSLCPGIAHQLPLSANIFTVAGASSGTYQWQQVAGATATISNTTSPNPTVSIPSGTADGDVFRFALTYTDTTGCITSDTIDIFMQNRNIAVDLTSDINDLCNNSIAQSVQLLANLDSVGINAANGVYTWNNTSTLSNSAIGNPTASLTGASAADSIQYIVRFDYGTCTGADTLTIRFRDAFLNVNANPDTICTGQIANLTARLTDTFVVSTPNCNAYDITSIPFNPVAGAGTVVTNFLSPFFGTPDLDEGNTPAIPIGFDFDFFCQSKDSFYLSTNGTLHFTEPFGTSFGPVAIPDNLDENDLIAFMSADLDLTTATVDYFIVGTAPNRRLVVNYTNAAYFFSTNAMTAQVVLYENGGIIEIHNTLLEPDPIGFSTMTQGVENATGTAGNAINGRNQGIFTSINQSFRFTPALNVVASVPTYNWLPNNNTLNSRTVFNPVANPTASTTYTVTVTDAGCAYVDSVRVVVNTALAAPTVSCGVSTTSTIAYNWGTLPNASYYEYSIDGVNWISVSVTSVTLTGIATGTTINLQVRGVNPALQCPFGQVGIAPCSTQSCNLSLNVDTRPATSCDASQIPTNGFARVNILSGTPPFSYNIGAGATTVDSFNNLVAGSYTLTVTETATGCVATNNFLINNLTDDVQLDAWVGQQGQDSITIFAGQSATINAGNNDSLTTYVWNGAALINNPNVAATFVSPTDTGWLQYVVMATGSLLGCTNKDTVWVQVQPVGLLGVPTAFTPNGDNNNDRFRPVQLIGADVLSFKVYNRWGLLVYDNNDLSNGGWDGAHNGNAQPRDVYIYVLEFKFPNESSNRILRGEVTLIR